MSGLADLFGFGGGLGSFFGGGDSALYGGVLTPEQQRALAQRGLAQMAGAFGQMAMPSRMPVPLGAVLGAGAAAYGKGADDSAMTAMRAQLVGQQGQKLKSELQSRQMLMDMVQRMLGGSGSAMGAGTGGLGAPAAAQPLSSPTAGLGQSSSLALPENLERDRALVKKYESEGDYNVGYGGVNLASAPLDEFGFPQWEGATFTDADGKIKRTHAAGAYQFQPATYREFAGPLGIKDFSPESQDRVFAAAREARGMSPWLPYNKKLAAAYKAGEVPGGIGGVPDFTGKFAGVQGAPYAPSAWMGDPDKGGPGTLPGGLPGGPNWDAQRMALAQFKNNVLGQHNAPQDEVLRDPRGSPSLRLVGDNGAPPSPFGVPQLPPGAQSAVPSTIQGLNPRDLAAMGVLSGINGLGDVFKPLENLYYQSPEHAGAKARAEAAARYPIDIAKIEHQSAEDIRKAWKTPTDLQKALAGMGLLGTPEGMAIQLRAFPDSRPEAVKTADAANLQGDNRAAVLAGAIPGNAPTSEQKDYAAYVKDQQTRGQSPISFYDWDVVRRRAGATMINTAEGLEAAQTKARVSLDTEMAKEIGKQATEARRLLPLLNEVERLADKTPGGLAGPVAVTLSRAISGMGLPVPEGMSNAEAMLSIGQQLLPLVRQPGQQSNLEMASYLKAAPGLMQSEDGRKKIVAITKTLLNRTTEIARVYRNNIGSPDLDAKLAELDKPILTEDQRAAVERVSAAPVTLAPGTIEDGYRFKGGDQGNPSNWEKVR